MTVDGITPMTLAAAGTLLLLVLPFLLSLAAQGAMPKVLCFVTSMLTLLLSVEPYCAVLPWLPWAAGMAIAVIAVRERIRQHWPVIPIKKHAAGLPLSVQCIYYDRCSGSRRRGGRAMNEIGWSGISGQPDPSAFERLIRRVNQCTLQACERILPACAGPETLFDQTEIDELELAGLSGADLASMVQPIRSILMRGGKGWRGYALALCCEAVGGDFSRFGDWLAFSEIVHVGSLIVDDVEDGSVMRRGDAACHMMYGVPIAINAGTLAYFVVQGIIDRSEVNSPAKARLYKEYVDLLRMAHVGQALDLALGIEMRTPAQLSSAPALSRLEQEVRRAHRLKSGVPFRGFARIGAILGGGAAAETAALGRFFLRIGTMFQLLDDVLNIQGFDGNLKQSGEDIAKGKLTLPILRAIQLMSDRGRADFICDWAAWGNDPARVCDLAGRVRDTGALSECIDEIRAEQIASWTELNAALDNSAAKANLKMFSERMLTAFY